MGLPSDISFGREGLASYASKPEYSRGRFFKEPASPTRTPFQRDRDRIIHSTAFRRLKHKTQVFVYHIGDHYRTRLTHSIEVAQIARALARALAVDEDLAEALALSHDFGHTPFGHAGEDALDEMMREHGGFDHNAQSLRIVTELEQQYADFDGLNLTWETLEGLVKHNGPLTGSNIPQSILSFSDKFDLGLSTFSAVEAQCAAVADDIAYNAHDIDDGFRAGLISVEDLSAVPIASDTLSEIRRRYPGLEEARVRHEIVRRQITAMVEDVIANAKRHLDTLAPSSPDDVRECGQCIVTFSAPMAAKEREIKAFLFEKIYRSESLLRIRQGAAGIIRDLFNAYMNANSALPRNMIDKMKQTEPEKRPRRVADFIAGMTDRFAINEHKRLFDETPEFR